MARRFLVAVALALLLSACRLPGGASPACATQIDWVDFIQVGSTQYVAGLGSAPTLTDEDLGPAVAQVKFKLGGNVCDPNYRPRDGDAAFLDAGTPIYQVNGYSPSRLLAAHRNGRVEAYQANTSGSRFQPAAAFGLGGRGPLALGGRRRAA